MIEVVKIYTEEDFLDLPEDERPRLLPYVSQQEFKSWVAADKYNSRPEQYAHSLRFSDRVFEERVKAVIEGRESQELCPICHIPHFTLNYLGSKGKYMQEFGLCFTCAFFEMRSKQKNTTIIDGGLYTPGSRTSGPARGMGGRRFDIEYIEGPHKGKRITTFDLWSGDVFPPFWRSAVPDTAIFLGDAGRFQVGDTSGFNPSNSKSDPYPNPSTLR